MTALKALTKLIEQDMYKHDLDHEPIPCNAQTVANFIYNLFDLEHRSVLRAEILNKAKELDG